MPQDSPFVNEKCALFWLSFEEVAIAAWTERQFYNSLVSHLSIRHVRELHFLPTLEVIVALFVLFTLFATLYPLGMRFIGRPMAEWSWRFWIEEPHCSPGVWSYLLYPLAHVTTPPGIVTQQYKLPYKTFSNQPFPGHTPLICQFYLYGESCGTSEGYVPGNGPVWVCYKLETLGLEFYYDDAKQRYIRHASWAWLLRLAALPVCHALAVFELPTFIYHRIRTNTSHAA